MPKYTNIKLCEVVPAYKKNNENLKNFCLIVLSRLVVRTIVYIPWDCLKEYYILMQVRRHSAMQRYQTLILEGAIKEVQGLEATFK